MLPSAPNEVRVYVADDETIPFDDWFEDLDGATTAKVSIAIGRLEKGNASNAKSVGGGVSELRIDWGPDYRIYFGREGNLVVILLTGGTKQRQQKDIERAKLFWADYTRRRPKRH